LENFGNKVGFCKIGLVVKRYKDIKSFWYCKNFSTIFFEKKELFL